MKVLIFEKRLDIGGTQVNSIELAAQMRDQHRHDVAFFAPPGPMVELVRAKRLRYFPAPQARACPSLARMRALNDVIRSERPQLVHVWDWPQCLDAYYIAHLVHRLPMVVTCMSMSVDRLLPPSLPTTFGTPNLLRKAREMGWKHLELILPPVDVRFNAPDTSEADTFRAGGAFRREDVTLVTVSRLANWMKAESIRRTIDAVSRLGRNLPLRLIVVGEGDSRGALQQLADEANAGLGREAITLIGPMVDPRPAYAAADVVVGMGGSSLRGMAFGKPVVVVGEAGFASTFTPATADHFYNDGMFGVGDGGDDNLHLISAIHELATDADLRASLGAFSREFALKHFSLDEVGTRLSRFYEFAASATPGLAASLADGVRMSAFHYGGNLLPRFLQGHRAANGLRRPAATPRPDLAVSDGRPRSRSLPS
jgi:L-malate glycosyltransferase